MITENDPKVSVGIPVRNGGKYLEEALEQIVNQSYRNIEIILSNNNSNDLTHKICKKFQNCDPRIKYYCHRKDLTALDNFRFVVERSSSEYFMWAAHDDRRSNNFIEVLVSKLKTDNNASIAFSKVAKFSDYSSWADTKPVVYDFEVNKEQTYYSIINQNLFKRDGYLHIYGLIRKKFLLEYYWDKIDIAGDEPLLFYLSCRGTFIKANGACFYCYKPKEKKTTKQRAIINSYRELKPFTNLRRCYACAKAGCFGEKIEGRKRSFSITYMAFIKNRIIASIFFRFFYNGIILIKELFHRKYPNISIGKDHTVAYITHNGKIPFYNANSIGVVKMCGNLANHTRKLELILPRNRFIQKIAMADDEDIWSFYNVENNFIIKHLNCWFNNTIWFSVYAALYAFHKGFSIVHTRTIEAAYFSSLLNIPAVFESHNFSKAKKNLLFKKWVKCMRDPKKLSGMIVTTKAGEKAFNEFGVPLEKILVLPNGYDSKSFNDLPPKNDLRKSLNLPKNSTIIGYCGSLYKDRGIEHIIFCSQKLKNCLFLVVGGSPKEIDRCQSIISDKSVFNVKLVGHVKQAMVPLYLKSCDVLLLPYPKKNVNYSIDFMSPMKMFDYLATGIPTVATDLPAIHEILNDKVNAIIVGPDSGEELLEGISLLLKNRELYNKIGKQSKIDSLQYSWVIRAKKTHEFHELVLNSQNRFLSC